MEFIASNVWHSVCGELEVQMTPASFNGWIKPCFIRSLTPIDEERLIVELATPSSYHTKTVDEKYFGQIKQVMEKVTGKKCEIALVVDASKTQEPKGSKQNVFEPSPAKVSLFTPQEEGKQVGSNLNPKYIFDSYVVGNPNRLAFAAAKAVAENPGSRHNPLFIYGGVGVGKTHLMHAVGHELVKKGVGKVVYVTSEQFTNDLVSSFRSKMTEAFKKKYRQVGALLIDDVQFFSGKESTQEEFFHTFNELTMKGAQIIMTSDRKPQDIVGLEDRLVSRFLGGMAVDIGLPDYEMKLAILRQKALEIGVQVDSDAFDLVASSMNTNARELEGTFVRLATMASIQGGVLTKEMVQQTMGLPAMTVKSVKVRPIKVISTVAKYFDYKNKDLLGSSRKADLVEARHITMFLLRDSLGLQFTKVGELMGGRDHTTVMHAVEKMKDEIENNSDIRRKVLAVKQALYT
ncbi:MAG TPA: chromosomal replication initiator protein DnaA [Patescibacteria group bacterium]